MEFKVTKTELKNLEPLRNLFLAENKFQFVYNKCHGAGWADTYLITADEEPVGYGSLWGKDKREDRDTIFEFYLKKPFRKQAGTVFPEFIRSSKATFVNCQTNDRLLSSMFFEFTSDSTAEAILFEDSFETEIHIPGTSFKQDESAEWADYSLLLNGETVATGGYVKNYNFPYIDMYYEVKEDHRRKGFGALITQELKKEAYRLNQVPSARCNVNNKASKATLLKAGMGVCGHILIGEIKGI